MKRTMQQLIAGLAITATFAATFSAQAQTVLYDDGFATGIRNMQIKSLCYDVEFVDGSYQSAFSDAPPTFLNQPAAASAAADEVRDVLNARRLVPEINQSDNEVLWVPNERVSRAEFQAAQVGHNTSTAPWKRFPDVQSAVGTDQQAWNFARFRVGPSVIYAANTGDAVGIHNLSLEGDCVDVRFADGSYDELYADSPPRYLGAEGDANNAANAIMSVLNAEKSVPEINAWDSEALWIPTDRMRTQFEAEQVGHDKSVWPWKRYGDFSGAVATDYDAWDFAVFEESLDCNRDGVVDIRDMNCACGKAGLGEAILLAIESVPGDLTGNGMVSFADFLQLSENYGGSGEYTDGDLNCDGMVGFADFLILSGNFGTTGGLVGGMTDITTVPEPSGSGLAWALAPMALVVMLRRKLASA